MSTTDSSKLRTCDIVMKGGITSGVVYPQAITRLAQRFTFKNIGGTSAGAIAAAIAAAAEYRRQKNSVNAGFDQLGKLPTELGTKTAGGRTTLFQFFQPNPGTERVFRVFTAALGKEGVCAGAAMLDQIFGHYLLCTLIGAVPGSLLAIISGGATPLCTLSGIWLVVSAILIVIGGALGGIIGFIRDAIRSIPANGYGLCSGVVETGKPGDPLPLSVWLHRYINETAGLDPNGAPLTFGQLWDFTDETKAAHPDSTPAELPPRNRRVNLEMMTTNITHRRPYRLPFRDDEQLRENQNFYFRPEELGRYFPAEVIQWMLDHPRRSKSKDGKPSAQRVHLLAAGFHPLPDPENLPVVVATRMSLSFPILLCAVPLHAIDYKRGLEAGSKFRLPDPCWFSDGGLCSNFPLHFFDSPLPGRPTFSIDLVDAAEDPRKKKKKRCSGPVQEPDPKDASLQPRMPQSNGADIRETWSYFDTEAPFPGVPTPAPKSDASRLFGFIGALIGTMQNWTDTTQSRLPGYRDRIVTVPLSPIEGGLNLDMPAQRIKNLGDRGEVAAEELCKHFDVIAPVHEVMNWDNHRWIRLLTLFGALEKTVHDTLAVYNTGENSDETYKEWMKRLLEEKTKEKEEDAQSADDSNEVPSYKKKLGVKELRAMIKTMELIEEIQASWKGVKPPAEFAPRPRPIMRPRPQI